MKTEHSKARRRVTTAAIALGALIGSGAIANAVSNSSTPAPAATATAEVAPSTPAAGTDTSKNDATHEAGETADHEANETAGRGGHGGHSNTDAAHAGESPARVAEEAARDAQLPADSASTTAK